MILDHLVDVCDPPIMLSIVLEKCHLRSNARHRVADQSRSAEFGPISRSQLRYSIPSNPVHIAGGQTGTAHGAHDLQIPDAIQVAGAAQIAPNVIARMKTENVWV